MSPRLKITENVLKRLSKVQKANKPTSGCLFGLMYDSTLLVIGYYLRDFDCDGDEGLECYKQISLNFPNEIDLCGLVTFRDSTTIEDISKPDLDIIQDVEITDNPLVLRCQLGSNDVKAYIKVHGSFDEVIYETICDQELWKDFIHVRLQTQLPLVCELQRDCVREGLQALRKKVAAGLCAFHFSKSNVYLTSSDVETGLSGVTGDPTIGEYLDTNIGQQEGTATRKKKLAVQEMNILHVDLLMRPTRDMNLETTNKNALVIQHVKRTFQCLKLSVRVDAFSLVSRTTNVIRLYGILIDSICRHLRLVERDLVAQLGDNQTFKDLGMPETFHFSPADCGHFVTLVYPKGKTEDDLREYRIILHKGLGLPLDRPCLRRNNQYVFRDEIPPNQPLINPHEGLANSGVKNGEVSLVQGLYSYHHYMQDRMDDNGWGCAYRSLQTLISWFRLQGYADRNIPSHREIQQCLVDIGDKPNSFVGTKQWIGSTEVGFILESLLGVTCRIISVNSGDELAAQGGTLVAHFATQGTPIMIGGGVLAHTILGVDYSQTTGELKFLILDPHYTGGEDLSVIQGKGWCGWKGTNFWVKSAYYNLCLPQRPRCV